MLNIGISELLVFSIIALIVLGPEKLPHAARMAGAWYARIRRSISTIQREIEQEVNGLEMKQRVERELASIRAAEQAMREAGVTPKIKPIRGGTDGSRLSFMGLPCPNLFTGGHNFHGKHEYIPVPSMEKAVATLIAIARLTVTHSSPR